MSGQPAGWYADPDNATLVRYWSGMAWTEHRRPLASLPAPPPAWGVVPTPARPTGKWYFVITLASVGLLAAVPIFHAAAHLKRPQLHKIGAGAAAVSLAGFALIAASPEDADGEVTGWMSNVAVVALFGVMVATSLLLIGLRREVYQPQAAPQPSGNQQALATVRLQRQRRDEARALAARDPITARDLGIGRPDAGRGYDDGGLLDLNVATAAHLVSICDVPPSVADNIVSARTSLGRFDQVEDAILFGQVGEEHAALIRDRGIVLAG